MRKITLHVSVDFSHLVLFGRAINAQLCNSQLPSWFLDIRSKCSEHRCLFIWMVFVQFLTYVGTLTFCYYFLILWSSFRKNGIKTKWKESQILKCFQRRQLDVEKNLHLHICIQIMNIFFIKRVFVSFNIFGIPDSDTVSVPIWLSQFHYILSKRRYNDIR